MPEQNARPAPASTTTPTWESAAAVSAWSASAAASSVSSALRIAGRSSVIHATPSAAR
jgi:hypothetical protein